MFDLTKDIEEGRFQKIGKPDRVIETLISKIFFFGNTVYKVYKWQKVFYGDLSDINFRRDFIREDFLWNNTVSPEVYIKFLPLKNINGDWQESVLEEANDICIVMNKLDSEITFTNYLERGNPDIQILKSLVEKIIDKEREISKFRKDKLSELFERSFKETEKEDMEDLRKWSYMTPNDIPKEKTDYIVNKLISILNTKEYEDWTKVARKSASIDCNGDNIIISKNGEIHFIDILPPKSNWQVEDEAMNICRVATDVFVLVGPETAKTLYDKYEEISGLKVPPLVKKLYEIRSAMIQAPYRFSLNQPDRANKFMRFVDKLL